ncbi:unnamed protein product, partial [Urochloa humidicola]
SLHSAHDASVRSSHIASSSAPPAPPSALPPPNPPPTQRARVVLVPIVGPPARARARTDDDDDLAVTELLDAAMEGELSRVKRMGIDEAVAAAAIGVTGIKRLGPLHLAVEGPSGSSHREFSLFLEMKVLELANTDSRPYVCYKNAKIYSGLGRLTTKAVNSVDLDHILWSSFLAAGM